MGHRLRYKGRFIKKRVLDKKMKIVNSLRKEKEETNNDKPIESNLIEGPRLVELTELGKNLRCCQCNDVLCLDNIVGEIRSGFNSILRVKCLKCVTITQVPTGKLHVVNNNKKRAVHAGYGCSGLNKILACSNMPTISMKTFKRKEKFDLAVNELVNIIVSYDMGWSKRGNGRSYDSLNGYGTIIGFLSGKILDYADRIRKCKYCDQGRNKDDHDSNLAARILIGDEDSSTIAAVRRRNPNTIFKLSDRNHLNKNFSKDLFNSHENCGSWCNRKNGSTGQKIILSDGSLYNELSTLFTKYAANAHKFSIAASS
ncbi:hypothetical protein PV327_007423 [Microctonus hyperodae]|uniref:Mutator-like transposase domain-containing protein n=1 Tax=Microctonus hyperodae TaxID=165561 RepID=A0AA39FZG8_MICHY|nr:hypothetical protein PV327_007423 [Microctonus hyperodae]